MPQRSKYAGTPDRLRHIKRYPLILAHPVFDINTFAVLLTSHCLMCAQEFGMEKDGYTATRHQREAGTGYFDAVSTVITQGASSTLALKGSTEAAQF